MKTFRLLPFLVGILLGLAVGWQAFNVADRYRCNAVGAVMEGTKACMDTPGCFYTAPDLVEAYVSSRYYSAHCKANERAE